MPRLSGGVIKDLDLIKIDSGFVSIPTVSLIDLRYPLYSIIDVSYCQLP